MIGMRYDFVPFNLQSAVFNLQSPVDVLDVHDGVVDQFPHRDSDSAERHDVNRKFASCNPTHDSKNESR